MNNQKGIALMVIVLILAALLVLGFFTWQRLEGTKEGAKIEKEETTIVVKQSGGAAMLIAECADQSYIAEIADYIIEGTVEKVESKWNEEKTSIFTYTELSIEKYIKGTPLAAKLQIITPGGTVGEVSQLVEDEPIFNQGKAVRISLQETNGVFSIVCGDSGISEVGDGILEPGVDEIK